MRNDVARPEDGRHPGLEVAGVHKRFGAAHVLRGVDVTVPAGVVLAVLGPSGCGKTTLLRAIAGFTSVDAGHVRVGDRTLVGAGAWVPPERRRVGIVPQEGALFPHLRVRENVAFGVAKGAGRAAQVHRWLEVVGLAHAAEARPHELSGGQQQRVELARALAADPELVLLDEPFAALDAGLRAGVRAEVARVLRDAGRTAVLVTHDQHEALSTADLVAVMLEGRVVQCAPPVELYSRPATMEVARFVGETVVLAGEALDGVVTCALGRMASAVPVPDGAVEVVLRPEQIEVDAATPHDAPRAVVQGLTYTGPDVVLRLALDTGAEVAARVAGTGAPPIGAVVAVGVRGPVLAYGRSATAGDPRR